MDRIVREAIEIEVTLTISTERVASMEAWYQLPKNFWDMTQVHFTTRFRILKPCFVNNPTPPSLPLKPWNLT
jgi:hypothetical protein